MYEFKNLTKSLHKKIKKFPTLKKSKFARIISFYFRNSLSLSLNKIRVFQYNNIYNTIKSIKNEEWLSQENTTSIALVVF
jgi:hypothetical protein